MKALSYLQDVVIRHAPESALWRCDAVVESPVAERIVNFAEREGVDLIAMFTQDRKGLPRLIWGSIAREVQKMSAIEVKVFAPADLLVRYLVVAHQTATGPELLQRVTELAAANPNATFGILVPATPVGHLLVWEEGETEEVARRMAANARAQFESAGVNVLRAEIGDSSPILAIGDELRAHPGEYDAIILSTLPVGISRLLRMDAHSQAKRKFELPVIHVVAKEGVRENDVVGV